MDFEDYVRAHATRLMRLAVVLCADSHEAEDVVQEVLLRAFHRWAHIGDLARPHAYVRRMIANEAVSWRRKWTRVEARPDSALDRDAADHAGVTDDRAALLTAITALPPKQRAAVVLRYFEDLTDAEIAQTLSCRTTTVRGYIHRALKTLNVDMTAADHAETQLLDTKGT